MSLERFQAVEMTFQDVTRTVYRAGEGPVIIVMHEMPGMHPGVSTFACELLDAGFSVCMPVLFGEAGRPVSLGYAISSLVRGCISREFTAWRTGTNSPITSWLRCLSRSVADESQATIGAVGMCFTGGFALAMMVDPWLTAPVCSQPSLPLAVFPWQRRDLGVDEPTLHAIRCRARAGTCVMALRYRNDPLVPGARFKRLRSELGPALEEIVIDHPSPLKHSVLVMDRDAAAVERVLGFFRQHAGQPLGGVPVPEVDSN